MCAGDRTSGTNVSGTPPATGRDGSPLLQGALYGVGAWLAALLVVGLVGLAGDPPMTGDVPLWKGLSWYFFDAQFVPVIRTSGAGGSMRMDLVGLFDSPLTPLAYLAPPTALAVAGGLAVSRGLTAAVDVPPWAAGLVVASGYVVPSVVLAAVSGHVLVVELVVVEVTRTIAPRFGLRLILVCVGYPLAFGGVGGVLAVAGRRRE
jgi:hypothetical protein